MTYFKEDAYIYWFARMHCSTEQLYFYDHPAVFDAENW